MKALNVALSALIPCAWVTPVVAQALEGPKDGGAASDTPASSAVRVTGSVGVVSEYRLRGVSFSDRRPAVQGGVTISHGSGAYAGFWSSNLAGYGTFGGANLEVDAIGGYTGTLGGTTYDGGLVWYFFPGTQDHQYQEIFGALSRSVGPIGVKVAAYYAPKRRTIGDADNLYLFGDLNLPLRRTPVVFKAHLGRTTGRDSIYAGPAGRYLDYSAGADVAVGRMVVNVSWVDTDLGGSRADAYYTVPGGRLGRKVVAGALVASLTAAF